MQRRRCAVHILCRFVSPRNFHLCPMSSGTLCCGCVMLTVHRAKAIRASRNTRRNTYSKKKSTEFFKKTSLTNRIGHIVAYEQSVGILLAFPAFGIHAFNHSILSSISHCERSVANRIGHWRHLLYPSNISDRYFNRILLTFFFLYLKLKY